MKDLFKRILKRIWHDPYLVVSFTMTCRQATDFRNTQFDQASGYARTKYYLHLSICDACTRYLQIAEYFEKSLAAYQVQQMSDAEVEKFNQRLIRSLKKN